MNSASRTLTMSLRSLPCACIEPVDSD
jgi:hypothetical protein